MSSIDLNVTIVRTSLGAHWRRVKQSIFEWRRRILSRRELAELDDVSLRDIGLSRADAAFEASKPLWMP